MATELLFGQLSQKHCVSPKVTTKDDAKNRSEQTLPLVPSEIQALLCSSHSWGHCSLVTHQQGTRETGCRHLMGSRQHTPQPRCRPWRNLSGGMAFCSAWDIPQTGKENEKGAWLLSCRQWQQWLQSKKPLLPMDTSERRSETLPGPLPRRTPGRCALIFIWHKWLKGHLWAYAQQRFS